MDVNALGRGIRERRLALDYGLEQLGRASAARGIRVPTGSYISRMERGKAPRPGLVEVEALVEALDVPDWKTLERIGLGELDAQTLMPMRRSDLTPEQDALSDLAREDTLPADDQANPESDDPPPGDSAA